MAIIKEMAVSLSFGPNRVMTPCNPTTTNSFCTRPMTPLSATKVLLGKTTYNTKSWWGTVRLHSRFNPKLMIAGSRADDSIPYEMTVENALKLLGVSEGASFDEILRAKNSILSTCRDDQEAISQVEAAYDMLLMQSLTQRRAGKVVSSNIRYADVKPVNNTGMSSMPPWLQSTVRNVPISIEAPSASNLGIQAGIYGTLMVLTYANGASTSSTQLYAGADIPGLILATSFGASLYLLTKKNIKLGKSVIITIGGLVTGAVVGSAVENWLQVDIVPFLGIHSPAVVVSEFIIMSQFLLSLYLR